MDLNFNERISTPLCEIMGRNGSDKGHQDLTKVRHNYTTLYYHLFKHIKDDKLRVFELGLGTNNTNIPSNMGAYGIPGASLYGWEEFFQNSMIFGADIDKNILFNTDRINTFYCDQTNPEVIKEMWENPKLEENFDIIVEDGLHEFQANVCFFENSIHKLKPNGYYIIEDINDINSIKNKIREWGSKYPDLTFKLLTLYHISNDWDNNLLIVHKY